MSKPEQEFYVGYMPQAPAGVARFTKGRIWLLALIVVVVSAALTAMQSRFSDAIFEFGEVRSFEGWIEEKPFPTLVVSRPGGGHSRYLLTQFGKFGAEPLVAGMHGQAVHLDGTLIYRDNQTMIELAEAPTRLTKAIGDFPQESGATSEQRTLVGEIVDSKCYLGVMKPGNLKPHRACATRCISGGVPPVLLTRDAQGNATYYLLTGADGESVNQTVVERQLIAEAVRITGEVQQWGDRLVLRADPEGYERLP